jgi:hypothetical protein
VFTTTTRGPPRRRKSPPEHGAAIVVQEGMVPAADHQVRNDHHDVSVRVPVAELNDIVHERREELTVGRLAQDELRRRKPCRARRAGDQLLPDSRELGDRTVLREDVQRTHVGRQLEREAKPTTRELAPRLDRYEHDGRLRLRQDQGFVIRHLRRHGPVVLVDPREEQHDQRDDDDREPRAPSPCRG